MIRISLKNLFIKIIAVLLSATLWVYVMMEKDYITSFDIPIELINMPEDILPKTPFPTTASVRLSGTGKQLLGLKLFTNPRVMVDVFGVRPGVRNVVINNADVFLGGMDVKVVAIEKPLSIEIGFDHIAERSVPIVSRVVFGTRKGYLRVGRQIVKPNYVKIIGPGDNIEMIDTIFTKAIRMENLDVDTFVNAEIEPPPQYMVVCSTYNVSVVAQIQKIESRQLLDIPVQLVNAPPELKVKLEPSFINLTIIGGERVVENFTPNDVNVFVDYRKAAADSQHIANPTIVKFKEVKCADIDPKEFLIVQLTASKKDTLRAAESDEQ